MCEDLAHGKNVNHKCNFVTIHLLKGACPEADVNCFLQHVKMAKDVARQVWMSTEV